MASTCPEVFPTALDTGTCAEKRQGNGWVAKTAWGRSERGGREWEIHTLRVFGKGIQDILLYAYLKLHITFMCYKCLNEVTTREVIMVPPRAINYLTKPSSKHETLPL